MPKTLTFFLCLCFFAVQSQRANVIAGEEGKTTLSTSDHFAKGKGTDIVRLTLIPNKHGIGGFAKYSHTPIFTVYNKRMEATREGKLSELDVNTSFDRLISMRDKLFLFTNQYEKDSKSTGFFCQQVNLESLTAEGPNNPLGKFEMSKLSGKEEFVSNGYHLYLMPGGKSYFDQQVVNYFLSSDSSKLLVAVSAPRAVSENEKYYVGVYDNNMHRLWERTIELPYQSKFVDLQSMALMNNGTVCAVIKHYETEKTKEQVKKDDEDVPAYNTQLLIFEKEKLTHSAYPIDVQGNFVHSLELSDSKDGSLHLFGLYQQKPGGNSQGFFNTVVKPGNSDRLHPILTPFSAELTSQVTADKQASRKGQAGIGNQYRIVDMVERNNGSKDYLLEYFSNTAYSRSENTFAASSGQNDRTSTTTNYYFYGNIININIKSADGSATVTKIPRFQQFPNFDMFGGFQALVQNDKLLLLFNDDESNATKKAGESPKGGIFFTTVMQMAVLDSAGGVKRSIVSSSAARGIHADIKNGIRLSGNTIAIALYSGFSAGSGKITPGLITVK